MISKKLNFVVDLKGEDILAPQFVPSHASALRQYQLVAESKENRPIFADYPEDFLLVTFVANYVPADNSIAPSELQITRFSDFIRRDEPKLKLVGDDNG